MLHDTPEPDSLSDVYKRARAAMSSDAGRGSGGGSSGGGKGKGKGGGSRSGKGGKGKGGGGNKPDADDDSFDGEASAAPVSSKPPAPGKGSGGRASQATNGSSSMTETEQDQFLVLAKQLAELSRAEVASHEALTKRVTELETALTESRKELADVRVRNEKLSSQLKAATAAADVADGLLSKPAPPAPVPAESAPLPNDAGEAA